MRYRYPFIFDDSQLQLAFDYLSTNVQQQGTQKKTNTACIVSNIILVFLDHFLQKYDVNPELCTSLLISYISENSKSYPMKIGEEMSDLQRNQMAIFLVILISEWL